MHHAHKENVQLHWCTGPNLSLLLAEAAVFAASKASEGGYIEVHSHLNYDNGEYEVVVYHYDGA